MRPGAIFDVLGRRNGLPESIPVKANFENLWPNYLQGKVIKTGDCMDLMS